MPSGFAVKLELGHRGKLWRDRAGWTLPMHLISNLRNGNTPAPFTPRIQATW